MTTDAHLSVFEQLDLPDTSLTRDTFAFAAQATPAFIHDHCVRSYVFARAHAQNQRLLGQRNRGRPLETEGAEISHRGDAAARPSPRAVRAVQAVLVDVRRAARRRSAGVDLAHRTARPGRGRALPDSPLRPGPLAAVAAPALTQDSGNVSYGVQKDGWAT